MAPGGQANLYAYVTNDPVNLSDSRGLYGFSFGIGAGVGFGFPLGLGGEGGVGIALDWTPGQGFTAALYRSIGGHAGAGFFAGIGADFSIFTDIENLAGLAVEAKVDVGLLGEGGDVGWPAAGKAGNTGVITGSIGVGAGLFVGAGLSTTSLEGFRVDPCGEGQLYQR